MSSIFSTDWIFSSLLFLLCYYFSIILIGNIRSRVQGCFGDYTAYELGYESVDLSVYTEPFNLVALVLVGIAYPITIPILSINISYPYVLLKLLIILLTETAVSLSISLISVMVMLIVYGLNTTIEVLKLTFSSYPYTISNLIQAINSPSPIMIVLCCLLSALAIINIFIASLSFIWSLIDFFVHIIYGQDYNYMEFYRKTIVPQYISFLLIAPILRIYLIKAIIWYITLVTKFIGMA